MRIARPAEHVGGAYEERVSDLVGGLERLGDVGRDRPRRAADAELVGEQAEALAVLRQVDRLVRRAEDAVAALLDRAREPERRLAAELGHDADGLLAIADREHLLRRERLEVETVGGVVVGRDGLGIAVDHDRLVAQRPEGLRRMHAAVVELDALADAVRAGAEDDDARLVARRRRLVLLAPGRVQVVRGRLDLAGARVDAPKHGADPELVPAASDLDAREAERLAERVVPPPGTLRRRDVAAFEDLPCACDLVAEPRMQTVRKVVVLEARPRRGSALLELARAVRLQQRFREGAADAHRLADGLHLGAERLLGAGELLEGEARELDDDVVQRGLEARRRRLRQVVGDLVERVPDRQLRCDLGDRVPGRLGRERRRARYARVHLDHTELTGLAASRELDVRAARLDTDGADDRRRRIAELLVRLVRQRHLRRHRDRVARVHAHRIEVLDRAHDHDVVRAIAHDLELELVPAADGILDEHLTDRRLPQPALDVVLEHRAVVGESAAVPAERERGPHDRRDRDAVELRQRGHDPRRRNEEPARADGVAEELAVLGAPDDVDLRADQLDTELVEHPGVRERDREVERRLSAERRQQRVGALALEHRGDALEVERLDVRAVGEAGVGHDRRRVRVDDDRAEALLAEHLERLAARVVELAGLADHDRAGADDADRLDVGAARH